MADGCSSKDAKSLSIHANTVESVVATHMKAHEGT